MRSYLIILISIGITACGSLNQEKPTLVNDQELQAFADDLVEKLASSPESAFVGVFDVDFLFDRMYESGLDFSITDYQIKDGFEEGLEQFSNSIAYEMLYGSYKLVRTEMREDGGHAIFRLYGEGGLNFHDFLIIKRGEKIAIGDVYIYVSGENFSKTLARIFLSAVSSSNLLDKNFSEDKLEDIKQFAEVQHLIRSGEYDKAYDITQNMSVNIKKEKIWHITNISCASNLDSATYITAMENFGQRFSNDPSWHLMGVDYYFMLGDYNRAINSLNQLQKRVGNDPGVNLLKSNLYWANGDYKSAYDIINANLHLEPDLADFYYTKASCEGNLGKYEALESTLREMFEKFEIEIVELDYSGFEDFQDTDGFRRLMEEQGYSYN